MIATKNGILQQKLTRNRFEPANNSFIIAKVPHVETSLRAAVRAEPLTRSQGHKHCNCTNECVNERCACRKASASMKNLCFNTDHDVDHDGLIKLWKSDF
ncbi:unnamed protein product, partial [Mesorhabditis belari]|uniref:Uncharacterized protein n=1 Tax=Mesorhabditis belari TaxID=2138241 RepID=A0AAF3FDN1_9BILA